MALRSQAETRSGLASSIQALVAPPGAESAHASLVSIVNEAAALLNNAATTTETDPFMIWTGSPGYQQLSARSDELTPRYESAKQSALSAAAQAIDDAQAIELPPKPKL